MISIIVSSQNIQLFKAFEENVKLTIGVDYEIIKIENSDAKYSIAKAYNIGISKANYKYVCFCHEDILFRTNLWGIKLVEHLNDKTTSLIGILGNTIKTKIPAGVYSKFEATNRINQIQRNNDGSETHHYFNPNKELHSKVITLDGMFLSARMKNLTRFSFDERIIDGFHGYDIDFSLSMNKIGNVIVVYNILIEHLSLGGNTKNWIESQIKIINKWHHSLPINYQINAKSGALLKESADLEELVRSLLRLKDYYFLAIKFFIQRLCIIFFSRSNLSLLKQLILTLPKHIKYAFTKRL